MVHYLKNTLRWNLALNAMIFLASSLGGQAPLSEPPLGPVPPSPATVRIVPFAQMPETAGSGLRARLSMLRTDPKETDVLWINDQRGLLYRLRGSTPSLFLDLRNELPNFIDSPGLGTGFQSFALHPEFPDNGRFYTVHTEAPRSGTPDFIGSLVGNGEFGQGVILEWTATDPSAEAFTGTRRELLRIAFPHQFHGIQEVAFNPNALPSDPDYGILYITVGDGGAFNVNKSGDLQRLDSLYGTVLRIDPAGNDGPNGAYGIPADNPFIGTQDARPEIFAYGFRNPHRIAFQPAEHAGPDGPFVFVNDVGERNFEEVNLLEAGANYGWPLREGTYLFRGESTDFRELIFPLPENDDELGFTYPIAQWDRSPGNGRAIGSGVFYYGRAMPDLRGHYIMGNIPEAELYHFPVGAVRAGSQAPVFELFFGTVSGTERFVDRYSGRIDIRMGTDHEGEILIMVKASGRIYRLLNDPRRWRGEVIRNGWAVGSPALSPVFVPNTPWIYSEPLNDWLYWPLGSSADPEGDWIFIPRY